MYMYILAPLTASVFNHYCKRDAGTSSRSNCISFSLVGSWGFWLSICSLNGEETKHKILGYTFRSLEVFVHTIPAINSSTVLNNADYIYYV